MSVLKLVTEVARVDKSTLTYICWGCGLGKTTCMMELGHMIGQVSLGPKSKKAQNVRLVLANSDLVTHYDTLFNQKESQRDPRLSFSWISMDTFKTSLRLD